MFRWRKPYDPWVFISKLKQGLSNELEYILILEKWWIFYGVLGVAEYTKEERREICVFLLELLRMRKKIDIQDM